MGARPVAVMDSLRFGPITTDVGTGLRPVQPGQRPGSTQTEVHKNHSILEGVVSGIASYGNCFGVPNLGGETKFEPCYSGNPLVNAFALGLVRKDQIFYAKASGEGNPVIYVGAKTGRDGIHGATMASEEFSEASEAKRPNVQVGDPFLENLLLEACLEAMQTGAVLGIQDMGAAGLTCSPCELGARGHVGIEIEIDRGRKRGSWPRYERMLHANGVGRRGAGGGGVIRLKDSQRGLAMALDGTSRSCSIDARLGAMHAVGEAARHVVCGAGTPVGATNCVD